MLKKIKVTSLTRVNTVSKLHLDRGYKGLLNEIKSKLKKAQLRAAISVNKELIQFYWEVGKLIIERQKYANWGGKLFDALSNDLSKSFPDTKGFSRTNLKSMRLFALHYPEGEFGQALPDQLTWTHHVILLQMINKKEFHIKQWYALQTVKNGWSYRELQEQVKADLYNRQANQKVKTTNFHSKLSSTKSELAQEMIKEPYKFHFLTIGKDVHEKEIQRGLVGHLKEFLMELGQGFALYGTHYPIHVSGKRFEIDLLFYNTKLHCYFIIELKKKDFQPEHTGQLNFYLSAIDDQLKMPEDGPTIGLILCERKDRLIAEYALRRVDSPMGIAEYQISKSLPSKLHNILPTTEEIEAELNEYAKELESKKIKKRKVKNSEKNK